MLVTKGAADSHNPLAHTKVIGVADLDGSKVLDIHVLKLDHCKIARGIGTHKFGLIALAIE